jgi:hypothetical protein
MGQYESLLPGLAAKIVDAHAAGVISQGQLAKNFGSPRIAVKRPQI